MRLLSLHKRAFLSSCARVIQSPVEHLFNVIVIGIIIGILSSVYIIGKNINNVESTNISYPQIIVSMQQDARPSDIAYIEEVINKFSGKSIKGYKFISKEEGLKDLQNDDDMKKIASDTISDMGQVVPDVLVINTSTANVKTLTNLKDKIANLSKVESVDLDDHYASKIGDLLEFAKIIVEFSEILFTVVLILVIYNIIRLQMLLRQDEISVSRLIGASDAFIMRPLIYYALVQVLLGAILSFYLVNILVNFLNGMFQTLGNLFGKGFFFYSLNLPQMINIFIILAAFSAFAVFIAVKMVFRNKYIQ